jgi:hypothetical protein
LVIESFESTVLVFHPIKGNIVLKPGIAQLLSIEDGDVTEWKDMPVVPDFELSKPESSDDDTINEEVTGTEVIQETEEDAQEQAEEDKPKEKRGCTMIKDSPTKTPATVPGMALGAIMLLAVTRLFGGKKKNKKEA